MQAAVVALFTSISCRNYPTSLDLVARALAHKPVSAPAKLLVRRRSALRVHGDRVGMPAIAMHS